MAQPPEGGEHPKGTLALTLALAVLMVAVYLVVYFFIYIPRGGVTQ